MLSIIEWETGTLFGSDLLFFVTLKESKSDWLNA